METSLLTIAREAMKPASSILDALLAPKIRRLAVWAQERDVQNRVEDPNLSRIFDSYLRRTLRKVSGLNTIVFPQQDLSLPEVYEPVSLRERHRHRLVDLAELRDDGACTYIVDEAGMGKSTFSRHLILEEIRSHDRIPLLFELRRINEGEDLLTALAKEFDDLDRRFDRGVLLRLLAVGRFLLVFDGFDEIPLARRVSIAAQIEELAHRSENSALVITSRPETDLPSIAGVRALEFCPLTRAQSASLVRRYDTAGGVDVGEHLILEFEKVPERFLKTPLMVALLYRTYGFNGTVSTRVSTFYDELYSALYKGHDLSKAGFAREKHSGLDYENFRRLLRSFSFLMISKQRDNFSNYSEAVSYVSDAERLAMVDLSSATTFIDDLLSPVPLLVRDGSEFRFVHRTVAEFFAAEYLAYDSQAESIIASIQQSAVYRQFAEVFNFLADISPLLFRRTVALPLESC